MKNKDELKKLLKLIFKNCIEGIDSLFNNISDEEFDQYETESLYRWANQILVIKCITLEKLRKATEAFESDDDNGEQIN